MNNEGKTADVYLGDNPQLQALYKSYGDGIWAAIETSNIPETERLIKGKRIIYDKTFSYFYLNIQFRFYQN
jgi:hypothetical protein